MNKQLFLVMLTLVTSIGISAEDEILCQEENYTQYARQLYSTNSHCFVPLLKVDKLIYRISAMTEELKSKSFEDEFWEKWNFASDFNPFVSGFFDNSAVGFTWVLSLKVDKQ